MSTELPASLGNLNRNQGGVFTRRQAIRAGLSEGLVDARLRRGAWRAVYPGVYTALNGQLGPLGRLWAPLLYAGKGAVLSRETAAELHKLGDNPSGAIHISIPTGRRVVPVPGVIIYRSARVFRAAMVHDGPPRTNVEETVLDLIDDATNFDDVCGWVTRAISRDLTDETRLCAAMTDRGRLRWRADARELITAAVSGDHSVLEFRYTRDVERPHGLPEPDRQVPFTTRSGRRGRRDRVYARYAVVVELDGRQAHRAEDAWRDKARDNAAAEAGSETLRYGWQDVKAACATAVQVAKVLANHGWDGRPRPCSVYCPVRF